MALHSFLAGAVLLFVTTAHAAHAIHLTKEEVQGVLKAVAEDSGSDAAFLAWAEKHQKPYATALQPYLDQLQQTDSAVFGLDRAYPPRTSRLITALLQALPFISAPGGPVQADNRLGLDRLTAAAMLLHQEHPELLLPLHEYIKRKAIWHDNARYSFQYNQDNPTAGYWLGLNSLSDLSFVEYKGLLGTRVMPKSLTATTFMYQDVDTSSLPVAIDWRNASAVTPVKNQGMCGSCWAFATTGTCEGINAIYSKHLVSLSEQELVDCDREVDQGCNGGMMNNAYEWIIQNHGLGLEEDWPYTAAESLEGCSLEAHRLGRRVTIDGFEEIPAGDEAALLKAVAHQPVAVAIEADSRAFQLYVGGVMSDPGCGEQLNHGVLVVGYGGLDHGRLPDPSSLPDPGQEGPYWLIKNSWGSSWGSDGYIKIRMGYRNDATGVQGLCGITLAASYAVKHSPNPPTPKPGPGPDPAPRPQPGPVDCGDGAACPPSSTCCCIDESPTVGRGVGGRLSAGVCGNWGCCPLPDATCCEDKLHCCPSELPVCDSDAGRCTAGHGQGPTVFSIPWIMKQPAVTAGAVQEQEQLSSGRRRKGVITTLKRMQVQR